MNTLQILHDLESHIFLKKYIQLFHFHRSGMKHHLIHFLTLQSIYAL